MHEIQILGSKVTDLTFDELMEDIDATVAAGDRLVIVNTNVHGILLARRHAWLRAYRNAARVIHCDGAGVVLAARILGLPMGERLSLNDHVWTLAEHCRAKGHSIYLFGAEPEVIEQAAANLAEAAPGLRIAGRHHGYVPAEGPEADAVIRRINESGANLLLVGMGMPLQEAWVRANAGRLDVNVVWVVGGLFKLVSGRIPFAPRWVRRGGLEWAWLSLSDPRRFFDRYLLENPRFLLLVMLQRLGMLRA